MLRRIITLLFFFYVINAQIALPTFHAVHKPHSSSSSSSSDTLTFTNCGATGKNGPSQSDCNSEYSDTSLDGDVTISSGFQLFTVSSSGSYQIEVWGAQGGRGGVDDPIVEGGAGAIIRGTLSLTQGTVLKILVGQKGLGGGDMKGDGGGAGFISNSTAGYIQAGIATSFTNGGTGATGYLDHDGGFGGGGGGSHSYPSGGGGGGYQGGDASARTWSASGQSKGGYSYNSGTDKADSSTLGYNSGQGKVIIIKL